MSEFIFSQKEKGKCMIVVDSSLETDFSSAKLLASKIKEISGMEINITRDKDAKNQKRIFIGTLAESPYTQKVLEKAGVLMGLNHPEAARFNSDEEKNNWYSDIKQALESSPSLSENRPEVIRRLLKGKGFLLGDLGEQGFIVYKLDDDTLILSGGSHRGTFYAVQTLINHLYVEDGNLKVENLHTEGFPIFNQPAIPCRGICTNIGGPDHIGRDQWVKEWQKEGKYDYKGFIDWLARFKITHLNIWLFELIFGIAYPSTKFPECVNRYHPNVKKEFIGEMIDYAHKRFIEVSMLIDFPDMFSGVLRHHPELGAKQFDSTKLPSEDDWEVYQKTGENKKGHSFRREFGTVCASKSEVMTFWEEYLKEVFNRYPGLDGIVGQFAEGFGGSCACDNCQRNFLKLQWEYFKRMSEIVQKDRPDRKIYNYASPGAVEILKHRNEVKNLIQIGWGESFLQYDYGCSHPHGEWYLLHCGVKPHKWHEFDWKTASKVFAELHFQGIEKRGVEYVPFENDYFAFGEFSWNPKLRIEDYADLYVKFSLRRKDKETSALYSHWIKAQGYNCILKQLQNWKVNKTPFSTKEIDREYPHLLKEELSAVSSLLKKIKRRNKIVEEIEDAFAKITESA